jgi:hypothetical protein
MRAAACGFTSASRSRLALGLGELLLGHRELDRRAPPALEGVPRGLSLPGPHGRPRLLLEVARAVADVARPSGEIRPRHRDRLERRLHVRGSRAAARAPAR